MIFLPPIDFQHLITQRHFGKVICTIVCPADFCGPVNYYRAVMQRGRQAVPKSKVQMPTLMIWGTNDGALEKKMADLSGNYVEDFTLHYIEGASHWVQQEEPQQVNAYMREFLENKKDR